MRRSEESSSILAGSAVDGVVRGRKLRPGPAGVTFAAGPAVRSRASGRPAPCGVRKAAAASGPWARQAARARTLPTLVRRSAASAFAARCGAAGVRQRDTRAQVRCVRCITASSAGSRGSSVGGNWCFGGLLCRQQLHTASFASFVARTARFLPQRSFCALGSTVVLVVQRLAGSCLKSSGCVARAGSGPRAVKTSGACARSRFTAVRGVAAAQTDAHVRSSAARRKRGESGRLTCCSRTPHAARLRRQARGTTAPVGHASNLSQAR